LSLSSLAPVCHWCHSKIDFYNQGAPEIKNFLQSIFKKYRIFVILLAEQISFFMKSRIISFIFISLLGVLIAGKAMSQEGIEEQLFKKAFPELQGNLLDSNRTDVSSEEFNKLRDIRDKLDCALSDLNAFKYGALTPENSLVFDYEKLKKAKEELDIEKLEKLITEEKRKIRIFLGKPICGTQYEDIHRNLALLLHTYKSKNWELAYHYWNVLFHNYPDASKSIYSKGANILEYKFEQTKDEKWIDTLMMLYDQRIKYQFFEETGKITKDYILDIKAMKILKYNPSAVDEAYALFEKSIALKGVNSEDAILLSYMQATEGMFVKNKIDRDKVVDNFNTITAILEERMKDSTNAMAPLALAGVSQIFGSGDPSPCEHLIPAFRKRFNKNKTDVEQLEKMARMLSMKDCTGNELFADIAAAIDSLKPAIQLKRDSLSIFLRKKEYDKAIKYLNEVIKIETEDSLKAWLYYRLAYVSNEMGEKAQAKSYALKAISLKSNFGAPYILIATMYASSGCSTLTSPKGELENVGYWAAVDKLVEAKSVDPSVSDAANKLIRSYSSRYPNVEGVFFIRGLTEGQTVKIGCWINETTTARF
jgi:tetratricopeptide (TPR) repeat protein